MGLFKRLKEEAKDKKVKEDVSKRQKTSEKPRHERRRRN